MKFSAIHRPVSFCVMIAFAALLCVQALPAPAQTAADSRHFPATAQEQEDDTPRLS